MLTKKTWPIKSESSLYYDYVLRLIREHIARGGHVKNPDNPEESRIQNPESRIEKNQESRIQNQESRIEKNQESRESCHELEGVMKLGKFAPC
jgi:hypothetical protein